MALEKVLWEVSSHPAVKGIVLWAGWKHTGCNKTCLEDKNFNKLAKGCDRMCFMDNNFKNLPLSDVVDRLMKDWRSTNLKGQQTRMEFICLWCLMETIRRHSLILVVIEK